jgi:hypothetical protein
MIGAASINVTATGTDTPLRASRVTTGTIAHSQTGKNTPAKSAAKKPRPRFAGKSLTINSPGTKTCSAERHENADEHKREGLHQNARENSIENEKAGPVNRAARRIKQVDTDG